MTGRLTLGGVSGETGALRRIEENPDKMQSPTTPKKKLGTTWFTRAKLVVAGAVLAGTAVFGTAVMSVPDAQPVDEQAGATWSFRQAPAPEPTPRLEPTSSDTKLDVRIVSWYGGGGVSYAMGATWS